MKRTFFVGALVLFATRLLADGTPCSINTATPPLVTSTLPAINGSVHYDELAVDMLQSPNLAESANCQIGTETKQCLFVPLYSSSDACGTYDLGICADTGAGSYQYCMVTDEFSQLGLILAMSTDAAAVTAFEKWANTIRLLSAYEAADYLPVWSVRVTNGVSGKTIAPKSDNNDASDATARIILALYIAAASSAHATNRQSYEDLAGDLANRFAHRDFRDTRNVFGGERYWFGGGRNQAINALNNGNPFTLAGYHGDAALAMLAAWRATGEQRYADLASDLIANYLRAAQFETTFRVPPMKFSWDTSLHPPPRICRGYCIGEQWDGADAPRAVNVCKAAYYTLLGDAPIAASVLDSVDDYCHAWMSSSGVVNGGSSYSRQYYWNGTPVNPPGDGYMNYGLGASLNFYLCPTDLQLRLQAAVAHYDRNTNNFQGESCFGIYTHAFFLVNYGSAIGRDLDAFKTTVPTPQNVTVTASQNNFNVSWSGSANVTYEIARSCNGETYRIAGTANGTTFPDTGLTGATYFYKVRAIDNTGKRSRFSAPASAPTLTLPVAIPRVTPILASDLESLRAGVNRLRVAAGAAPKSYTTLHANDPIRASEFTELQNDINDARDLLDRPEFDFRTVGGFITAEVIQELRDAICTCGELNLKQATE